MRTQFNIHATAQQLDVKVSQLTKDSANTQTAFERRTCITPKTFSEKLYQSQALEIAEEFEQALESQSLSRIQKLLNKVLEKTTGI